MAELRLSSKKDATGRSQVIVKFTISRESRPCFKSGVYVMPEWFQPVQDTKRGSVYGIVIPKRGKLNVLEVQSATEAKQRLDTFINRLTKVCNELLSRKEIPSREELEQAMLLTADLSIEAITYDKIAEARSKQRKKTEFLLDIEACSFFEVMEKYLVMNPQSQSREKGFKVLMRMMARYQSFVRRADKGRKDFTLNIHTIDRETIEDFFDYVKNEKALSEEYPELFKRLLKDYPAEVCTQRKSRLTERGSNTLVLLRKKLKAFFNWLYEKGVTDNMPFRGLKIGVERYGTPYYLTLEERNLIADYDFSDNKHLETQRDIFIFQCLIGCRVSDLLKMTDKNVIDGFVEYIAQKTIREKPYTVQVPLNSRASALVKKYKGVDKSGRLFPFISATKYNVAIKEVLTACGINRMVTVLNSVTGEQEQRPINELASSHMARRTFIGNIYKKVKDPNLIGVLSGHTEGSRAFARYRDIDDDVKRETVALID